MSKDTKSIFHGLELFIGTIVLTYIGMFSFQQYDVISSQTKEYRIPQFFANTTASIALIFSLYYLILGIMEVCTQGKNLVVLYENLARVVFWIPVFIVSLKPSNISISIKDENPISAFSGILHFSAKSVLFSIPFVWAFNALHRIIHMLIHLGAEKEKVLEAFNISQSNLLSEMLYPIGAYVGYLLFNFIYTAIYCCIENKKK